MVNISYGKWLLLAGMMVFGADPVSGQNYPNKPIRVITSTAGGGNDLTSRLIAQALTESLGQQVVVDNRGGASGIIAAQM